MLNPALISRSPLSGALAEQLLPWLKQLLQAGSSYFCEKGFLLWSWMRTAVCWEATFLSVEVTAIIFSRRQEIGVTEITQGPHASPTESSKQLPEVPDRPWATP